MKGLALQHSLDCCGIETCDVLTAGRSRPVPERPMLWTVRALGHQAELMAQVLDLPATVKNPRWSQLPERACLLRQDKLERLHLRYPRMPWLSLRCEHPHNPSWPLIDTTQVATAACLVELGKLLG